MFNKWIFSVCFLIGLMATGTTFAAKHKAVKKKVAHSSAKHTEQSSKKHKSNSRLIAKHSKRKGGKSRKGVREVAEAKAELILDANGDKVVSAPLQMIAQNKEKSRISDSVHKTYFTNNTKEVDEGFFASSFAAQRKVASFQTLEGTAAVFKSVSGWEDKKFYVLTNQLPVGTIVRITTSDLKSICAKVINVLPEVGNAIQYRLNDAAAAILGITNKTFQVSVTY
jgi:hypothetical protein